MGALFVDAHVNAIRDPRLRPAPPHRFCVRADNGSLRSVGQRGVFFQQMVPRGDFRENTRSGVRPYLTGGLGTISFSSFDNADGSEADTGACYLMSGASLRIPAWKKGSIDLALRHYGAGPVSYLSRSSQSSL